MPYLEPGDTLMSNDNLKDIGNIMPGQQGSWSALAPSDKEWPAVGISVPDAVMNPSKTSVPLTSITFIGINNVDYVIIESYDGSNTLQELVDGEGNPIQM